MFSGVQEEGTLVQFFVCFREAVVQAKVVRPGCRAKCLCPLHWLLNVTLKRPMAGTDAGLHVSTFAHEDQECLNVLLWYHVLDLYHDGTASWLQI